MKKFAKRAISLLCAMALAVGCAGCSGAQKTAEVTQIMIWTYYNGDQLESFNRLVETFNDTVGKEKNIRAETESQGSVNDLEASVMDSAEGKVGAAALPNIFSAYSDTAYAVDQMGLLVDLSQYLTADEQAQFIEGYRTEGDFDGSGSMKIFPVAKSTELKVLPCPKFADGEDVAVQQGAGMVVTTGTDAQVQASVEFLKWFVQPENNIAFSVGSGYLPVTRDANNMEAIHASGLALTGNMEQILTGAVQTVENNKLYTPRAFEGGNSARKVLEYGLSDLAEADRETVTQRIDAGQSAAEAEAEFLTDAYFEAWYQDTCRQLKAYEG